MPTFVPAKKNASLTFYVGLVSQANTKILQANPTLAAGDVRVAIDDGAPANLGTLPVVDADFTKRVKVVLSAAEMNGDNLTVIFADAAGAEWCDLIVNIQTVTRQIDDLQFPNVSGRGVDVDATGGVEITTGQSVASVTGSVGSVAAGGIAASSFAAGAIDAAAIANAAIDAATFAAGAIDAAAIAANAIDADALAADAGTEIADALLKRDMSAVTGESARSALNALRKLINKWSISGTTLTVTKEDDITTAYTQTVTATAGADPITALDTV